MRIKFDHREELVWRKASRTAAVEIELGRPAESSRAFLGHQNESLSTQDAAATASRNSDRAPTATMTKLDPLLMDRLTDDVIRRVEQRMRIDRQRRGL